MGSRHSDSPHEDSDFDPEYGVIAGQGGVGLQRGVRSAGVGDEVPVDCGGAAGGEDGQPQGSADSLHGVDHRGCDVGVFGSNAGGGDVLGGADGEADAESEQQC